MSTGVPDADAAEDLWLEIMQGVIRGGMFLETAVERVELLSRRGPAFAQAVLARYLGQIDELLASALE